MSGESVRAPRPQHPSGRPVRKAPERRYGRINWNYPAETYATPRLRQPAAGSSAYAVSSLYTQPAEDWSGAWAGKVGFVHFKD